MTLSVQCTNCGSKYKLPDTFKAATARCKSCGETIQVKDSAAAPVASTAPSTPSPAAASAAQPAMAAKAGVTAPVKPVVASTRSGSKLRDRHAKAKGKPNMVLIGAAILGILAIVFGFIISNPGTPAPAGETQTTGH